MIHFAVFNFWESMYTEHVLLCHCKATHHFKMYLEEILVFFLYLGKWYDYQIHSDVCCVASCAIMMM